MKIEAINEAENRIVEHTIKFTGTKQEFRSLRTALSNAEIRLRIGSVGRDALGDQAALIAPLYDLFAALER